MFTSKHALYSAAVVLTLIVFSAPYAQNEETELTVEERIEQLERQLARLETRFETRAAVAPSADIGARLNQLERTVSTMSAELDRLQRQTEAAVREAADARREAIDASREARNAQNMARQNALNLSRLR